MKKLSFVIPCYGSEHTIEAVVTELKQMLAQHTEYEYELVLVNDHSPDGVWSVISRLAKSDGRITGINFARNFGQHAALMAGYRVCTGDIVISLDDDGQAPVDEIFLLVDKINEGYDLVYGEYPEIKQNHFRRFGSWVNGKMTEIMLGKPKGLKITSFYAARRFVIDEMLNYHNAYPYVIGLAIRSTQNIANVTVHQRERAEGSSGYTFRKLLKLWFNGFTAFSEKPLRVATILGVGCALLGFLYGLYVILHKLFNPAVQMGYSSMMAVTLFIGGVLMLLLGIIGEYVGRIYVSLNNAPQYVIRETVTQEEKKEN